MIMCSMPECQTTAGCLCRPSVIICDPPGWHSQNEVNELQRRHIEAVGRLVDRIEQLERELASARSEARKAALEEALHDVLTPDEIAAAWATWKSRHGGKLGPGPAFREAVEAVIAHRARRLAEQEGT